MTSTRHVRDERLVELLAAGRTATEAAATLSLSVSTVYRRLRDDRFQARLLIVTAAGWRAPVEQLRSEVERSIKVLAELRDNAASEGVRLKAAATLLDLVMHRLSGQLDTLARDALAHRLEHFFKRDEHGEADDDDDDDDDETAS